MLTVLLMMTDERDRDKLEELYLTYCKEMLYVANLILKNHHDAEDVVQASFIKMSKHLDKIGEIKCKKTRAYVVIIVRNLALDRYRQKKRAIPTDFSDELYADSLQDDGMSLEQHVLNLENSKEIMIQLMQLNQDYSDILALRYFHEYSNPEIADLLGITVENVSVRLYRAKAALKKLLSEGGT